MASVKAIMGNQQKVSGENELSYSGTGLYAGQGNDDSFPWDTGSIVLTANLLTVDQAIRAAIVAASEAAGNSFNQVTDTVILTGGPLVL